MLKFGIPEENSSTLIYCCKYFEFPCSLVSCKRLFTHLVIRVIELSVNLLFYHDVWLICNVLIQTFLLILRLLSRPPVSFLFPSFLLDDTTTHRLLLDRRRIFCRLTIVEHVPEREIILLWFYREQNWSGEGAYQFNGVTILSFFSVGVSVFETKSDGI